MRRQFSLSGESRITDLSPVAEVGNRRVTSLTRSQAHTLKSFTASFNFTSTASPSVSSKNVNNISRHMSLTAQVTQKLSSPSPNSKYKTLKTPKEKRRSNKPEKETVISSPVAISGTQWYTTDSVNNNSINGNTIVPIVELRQELKPKRPLRTEVEKEKRLSRPPSGQFQNSRPSSSIVTIRANGSSGNSSNRDSVGTTDSAASEEDPPPLPIKMRESDYCNLPEAIHTSFLYSGRVSFKVPNKPLPPEPVDPIIPPVPPPKPPKP